MNKYTRLYVSLQKVVGSGHADLAGHVVLVDHRLSQEHVQTLLVLGQRVTCHPANEKNT